MIWADPKTVRSLYGQLVREYGGVEATALLLGVSKGTVSKQMSGQAEVAFVHVGILESAVGRYPLTDLFQRRRDVEVGSGEIASLAEIAMTELGDVGPAILRLVTTGDCTSLRKEGPEVIAAIRAVLDRIGEGDDV
jgi:DNA-binding transcriptional regulator YdaS (Cro superfamily)